MQYRTVGKKGEVKSFSRMRRDTRRQKEVAFRRMRRRRKTFVENTFTTPVGVPSGTQRHKFRT